MVSFARLGKLKVAFGDCWGCDAGFGSMIFICSPRPLRQWGARTNRRFLALLDVCSAGIEGSGLTRKTGPGRR